MHPSLEDKDPPAYDSMYPRKAQKEQKDVLQSCFSDMQEQALRRISSKEPPEVVVTRNDSKMRRKAGTEGKEATAEGPTPKSEERREEEKKERERSCISDSSPTEVLK